MSLLSASPLLSSLFLTYANRAATLDGPAAPSPIDVEWMEMKTLNNRLQEEVALLRDQLNKETDRAKVAEDCVEALRAQLSSVKCTNRDLETEALDERSKLDAITSEYMTYKKEAKDTIAELRKTVDKEASARAALSQVIADQQTSLAQLKGQSVNPSPDPPPVVIKESLGRGNRKRNSPTSVSAAVQSSAKNQQGDPKQPEVNDQKDGAEGKVSTPNGALPVESKKPNPLESISWF